MTISTIFQGNFFHAPVYGEIDYLPQALVCVNSRGIIEEVIPVTDTRYKSVLAEAEQQLTIHKFAEDQYILPGFVDLHVHAPQWPQAGVALDAPLNVWLDECTFPLEASYQEVAFAEVVYKDLIQQLLSRGTTTVLYFATVHKEASLALARLCGELGQRGLVGKVVMDHPTMTPEFYRDETAQQAITETEAFIKEVQAMSSDYIQGVYPVVTPRFVPSCSDEALAGLGQLAKMYDVHVQSHCSEGDWEHQHVFERFGRRDTEVLEGFGLLGEKSVMAHCNFLNEEDGAIFQKTKTAVAHCPISNAYFANSVLPVQRLHEQGVTVGLGTDISGGFSPSLYENIRQVVMSSRMLEEGVDTQKVAAERGVGNGRLTVLEAFYLATTAGGEALSLPIGTFAKGQVFDAQVIQPDIASNPLPNFGKFQQPEQLLAKIIYLADQSNIRSVWVQGQQVHQK